MGAYDKCEGGENDGGGLVVWKRVCVAVAQGIVIGAAGVAVSAVCLVTGYLVFATFELDVWVAATVWGTVAVVGAAILYLAWVEEL